MNSAPRRRPRYLSYILAGLGLAVIVAIVVIAVRFPGLWRSLEVYSYLGAFLISIAGGATIIVPVPMLPVVVALGALLPFPALVGVAAGAGETLGALTIYATGGGGGAALMNAPQQGRLQRAYARLVTLMEHRGWLALFIVSALLSPLFYPVALTAGALQYDVRRFTGVVLAGKIIKGLIVAYAGHYGLQGLLHLFGRSL
ncbi:MAG: VTT domain-containing protein [Chloroflexi bacterium]|nr:VTT domain-containing protein [Chloroflexota bacterium]